MWAIHAEMDLDDTLLGFDHMTSRFPKEKYCKKKSTLYYLFVSLKSELTRCLKENNVAYLWKKLERLCMMKALTNKFHIK